MARGGVGAVRVEVLARSLGVTKGSFYHHFSKRADLLEAMLDTWREIGTEAIIVEADTQETPRARLERLVSVIFPSTDGDAVESALRA